MFVRVQARLAARGVSSAASYFNMETVPVNSSPLGFDGSGFFSFSIPPPPTVQGLFPNAVLELPKRPTRVSK